MGGCKSWLQLVERLMGVQLNDEHDKFIWHLTISGIFLVKFFYAEFNTLF
jgi:hypothetical protein